MKTPQRKFVVEFKSGRRLPKNGANSIWGDTDFKALAREVEDQSSHLFGAAQTTVPEVTEPNSDIGVQIPAGAPVVECVAPQTPTIPMSAASTNTPASTPAVNDEGGEPAPNPIELARVSKIDQVAAPEQISIGQPVVSKTTKTPKKAPRKRVVRVLPIVVPTAKDEPQVPPTSAVTGSTAPDDLDTLDAENKRLRLLLANQLRAQNAQLKRMLERF